MYNVITMTEKMKSKTVELTLNIRNVKKKKNEEGDDDYEVT